MTQSVPNIISSQTLRLQSGIMPNHKQRGLRPTRKFFLFMMGAFLVVASKAQTYTTVASGNWTSAATWAGGVVPSNNISSSMILNIKHKVICNLDNDIVVAGKLNIIGDTLRFPTSFTKKLTVSSTGQLIVMNGGFQQDLIKRDCEVIVDGGYLKFENAKVSIGKTFKGISGGKRFIKNSIVKIGESFLADGSSTAVVRDTIQNSTIEISVSGGGSFEVKNYTNLKVVNARTIVNDGDFKTDANSNISLLAGPANYYGFVALKTNKNLDVSGTWDARIDAYCVGDDVKGSNAASIDFTRGEDCSLTPTPATLGQLVINEVYTDPGAGKQEFIELYNISLQPESVNNYSLVTYFETEVLGISQKGFYVLDFPDYTVAPASYFVGAAAFPFSYQGFTNSNAANFNWNNLLGGSSGSLKKWIYSNDNNEADGNKYYNQSILPSLGLNDLFNRLTGDVAYTMLLFKNGILVNQIIAGAGGASSLSTSITTMPVLNVDMTGSSPDFSVDFASLKGLPVEKIGADAGSDNGFIREIDGSCSSWKKSSSGATHTPNQQNGLIITGTSGDVVLSSSILRGTASTGSTVNYAVQTASSSSFSVELRVYLDNGMVDGEFDPNDTHIDTKTAYTANESFATMFQPYDENILIVVKRGAGCVDNITLIKQAQSVLPITYTSFAAMYDKGDANLTWGVIEGEGFSHFVVQRSINGSSYSDVAVVFSGGSSFSNYPYNDKALPATSPIYYYRIKGVEKSGAVSYSQVRIIRPGKPSNQLEMTAYPNPVKERLQLTLPIEWQGKKVLVEVINTNGITVSKTQFNVASQTELLNVAHLPKGGYIVKAQSDDVLITHRLIKN